MGDYFACIYGKRGQGKSTLLRRLVSAAPVPAIWVDPLHEHRGRPDDLVVRPGADVWGAIVEAAREAYRVGKATNPTEDRSPEPAVVLAVDEIDTALRHHGYGGIPRAIDELARYGRHFGVWLVLAARRPADIHVGLASQATDIFTFRQIAPRDLDYFRQLGIPPEMLRRIPEHAFVHVSSRGRGEPHVHAGPWTVCDAGMIPAKR